MAGPASDPILARWLRPGAALPELTASSVEGILAGLADGVARTLPGVSRAAVLDGFREREALGTTAVGGGFAIPHCRLAAVREIQLRVALCPAGVDFGAADGAPVRVFFALLAPQSGATAHLEALRAIARFLRDPARRAHALAAHGPDDLLERVLESDVPAAASEVTADV